MAGLTWPELWPPVGLGVTLPRGPIDAATARGLLRVMPADESARVGLLRDSRTPQGQTQTAGTAQGWGGG